MTLTQEDISKNDNRTLLKLFAKAVSMFRYYQEKCDFPEAREVYADSVLLEDELLKRLNKKKESSWT